MREAIRRERGYIALALICALLAGVSVFRTAAMRSDTVIEVADFKPPVSALIDINSADISLLISLPGVGEKTAQRIIDGRPYESVDDLRIAWAAIDSYCACTWACATWTLLYGRAGR